MNSLPLISHCRIGCAFVRLSYKHLDSIVAYGVYEVSREH